MNEPVDNSSEHRETAQWRRLNLKRFSPLIGISLFAAALVVLHRSTHDFRIHDSLGFIEALPDGRVYGAVLLVLVNFLLFTGYDWLALRYVGARLPLVKVAGTAMLGFAFSNVVGGMVLAGGGIRYRSYSNAGMSASDILRVTIFIWMSWLVGLAAFVGVVACVYPHALDPLHGGYLPNLRWIGVPVCLGVVLYLILAARGGREFELRGMKWSMPSLGMAVSQVAVTGVDLLVSAAILYLLLPETPGLSFPVFAAVFSLALTLALFSGIPGGLGVFEVLMLHLLNGTLAPPDILGALVVFRVLYYLLPLATGSVVLGVTEASHWLRPLKPIGELATDWAARVIPQVFSAGALVAGAVMLVTGTLPTPKPSLEWVQDMLPLGLFEMSHFLGSIVGMLLVLFSFGLQRRQRGTYVTVLLLLAFGALIEVIKGHAYLAAISPGCLFLALLPCYKSFTRHSRLLSEPFSWTWLITVTVIAGSVVWLVFFNYRHVEYTNELWWRFSLHGNASRAMRSTAGATVVLLFLGLRMLLRAPVHAPHVPTGDELEELRGIIANTTVSKAALAMLRDKAILFSENRKSFIMYGVVNRVWVAMGEPIGDPEDFPELIWTFRSQCDRYGARPVFYEIGEENMASFADAGFSFFKLGEEAMIPLKDFSLEGAERRGLRYAYRKIEKLGYVFEVLPREAVPELLLRLRHISDAWLETKSGKEKSFSLGCFDDVYMQEFPVAVVRDSEGSIIAFANLWPGDGHSEFSMDLMRYVPDAPHGIMDYLFASLLLWGREQGYEAFNMGMAPLSGLESHRLSPIWSRIGVWVFQHGEHFYNFQGLRQYKNKFGPQWRPSYLASLGNTQIANEIWSINTLVSGGLMKMMPRPKGIAR